MTRSQYVIVYIPKSTLEHISSISTSIPGTEPPIINNLAQPTDPRSHGQLCQSSMASMKRAYPRTTLRKIVKAHTNKNASRHTDALIYLDYILFMQQLMDNSIGKAKESGETRLQAKDIRKATLSTLRQFKG